MEMEAELVAQRHEIDERFAHFALTLSKRERTEFLAKIGASALMFVGFWVVGAVFYIWMIILASMVSRGYRQPKMLVGGRHRDSPPGRSGDQPIADQER